jgi:(S)-ureidoglycine aminohydrolase
MHCREVHYNQHGLLLLEGQGIYRLADDWYPVQTGDAIYMAPYVTQVTISKGQLRSCLGRRTRQLPKCAWEAGDGR